MHAFINTTIHRLIVSCIILSLGQFLSAQANENIETISLVTAYLQKHVDQSKSLTSPTFIINDHYIDQKTGIEHLYIQHLVNNIPIIGGISSFAISKDREVIYAALTSQPFQSLKTQKKVANISALEALKRGAAKLGYQNVQKIVQQQKVKNEGGLYRSMDISDEEIKVDLAYWIEEDQVILVWEISLVDKKSGDWIELRIDASSGEEVSRFNGKLECNFSAPINEHKHNHVHHKLSPNSNLQSMCDSSYQVFAYPLSAPNDGDRSIVTSPWQAAPIASPLGWHDTTIMRGNNVYASEDQDDDDMPGYSTDGGSSFCFEFPFDPLLSPESNIDASMTNLFYWNNLVHDVMYNYGFDEDAGNFQASNFGRGGIETDRLIADLLDGSGLNNANFSTRPDGFEPRMQMFKWTAGTNKLLEVNSPAVLNGLYSASTASFGPSVGTFTGSLSQLMPSDGCSTITNPAAIIGKIALVDRGACSFIEKVAAVQNAGAIAMLVCNNVAGNPFSMGGDTSLAITIPSIMVSQEDCDTMKSILVTQEVAVTITLPEGYDSALDNGIVVHEYAHGISSRLTGGPATASCLGNTEQMGEGWSDWYALMFSLDASDMAEDTVGIGTYVSGQSSSGAGIRNYPYSTDLAINPVTYDDIKTFSIPHGIGSVWSSMLWEVTWILIDQHGFDSDIYNGTGGNNMALRIVTMGLKLQTCGPGFIDGRDAIIAADEVLYDGANKCLIWEAFAKRGLGFSASQGSPASRSDGTEAFDMPPICTAPILFSKSGPAVSLATDTIQYKFNVRINNTDLDSICIADVLTDEMNYVSGDPTSIISDTLIYKDYPLEMSAIYDHQLSITISPSDSSNIIFLETVDNGSPDWNIIKALGDSSWGVSNANFFSGDSSFFCPNVVGNQTQYLVSPTLHIGTETILGFWHYFDTEIGWDGGFVEISVDGGSNWIDLKDQFIVNGYNMTLEASSNPESSGRRAFSGTNNEFQRSWIDLSPFANQAVQIRFVFASDLFASEEGWYVDQISLYEKYEIINIASMTASNGTTILDSVTTILLPSCEPCMKDLCQNLINNINPIDQSKYISSDLITSDGQIPSQDQVQFIAANSILLNEDFTVEQTAVLEAIIRKCIEP